MQKLSRLIRGVDLDDFLGYSTVKYVKIQDRRIGIIHYLAMIGILIFLLYYILFSEQGYNEFDNVEGDVKVSLLAKSFNPSSYDFCSSSCQVYDGNEVGCNCLFWDGLDVIYPEEEEYSSFIATSVTFTQQQKNPSGPCSGNLCTSPWNTGSFFHVLSIKLVGTTSGPFFLVGVDQFNISIFHEATAPKFEADDLKKNGNRLDAENKWLKQSKNIFGQVFDLEGNVVYNSVAGNADNFQIDLLLKASGVTFDQIHQNGGIIRVLITYGDCNELIRSSDKESRRLCNEQKQLEGNGPINYYMYQPEYVPNTEYNVVRTIYSVDGNSRTLRNMTGIRIYFNIDGEVGKFNFVNTLLSLVSVYIIYSVAVFVMDFIVMYLIPGSRLYREARYEKTQNFNDMRRSLMREQSLKKKISNVTKISRFGDYKQVEELITSMKANTLERDWDQIVLACIEVYGTELLDRDTANKLLMKLNLETSKARGHVILGDLKEAYLIAARLDEPDLVRFIKQEATILGNNRVMQLCDQYLSEKGGKKEGNEIELQVNS